MKTPDDKVLIIEEDVKPSKIVLFTPPKKRFFKSTRVVETDSSPYFKIYIILFMISIWASHTLLVRYTRSKVPVNMLYASSTVVFLSECLKISITAFFIFKESKFSPQKTNLLLRREFFGKPLELLKMSVPSITYAVQNNLEFIALSNLEASIFQVTTQLKLISTAIFMMIFLGRRFSLIRWIAIFILFCGIACVQVDKLNQDPILNLADNSMRRYREDPLIGFIAVLFSCILAGFAGVYFEKMLKDGSTTPFWIRNLQMYFCGVISSAIACFVLDSKVIQENGFFYGYNQNVWTIAGLLGVGGVFISLMMKHMDNLYKSFASSISIILVVLLSVFVFDQTEIGILFGIGASAVCIAIVLYNSVKE